MEVDEFLAHYGVKGMKWGVRRRSGGSSTAVPATVKTGGKTVSAPSSAAANATTKKPAWQSAPKKSASSKPQDDISQDAAVFKQLREKSRTKGIHSLSNEEIRVLTTRARAMDDYYRTFPTPPPTKSRKRKVAEYFVKELLVEQGKKQLKIAAEQRYNDFAKKQGWVKPSKPAKKVRIETTSADGKTKTITETTEN